MDKDTDAGETSGTTGVAAMGAADIRVARAILSALWGVLEHELAEDPELSQRDIAALINRPKGTVEILRARSKPDYRGPGRIAVPMPEPTRTVSSAETGSLPRPLWHLTVILPWLIQTRRWYRLLDRVS
jgi:hypothetical protein